MSMAIALVRLSVVIATAGLSALFVSSCGGAKAAGSNSASAIAKISKSDGLGDAPVKDGEGDYDDPHGTFYDSDDQDVIAFGQSASQAVRRHVAALVMSYHDLAARQDGAGACRLLNPVLAELVTETYSQVHVRHRTCASVLSAYYARIHRELVAEDTAVAVGDVRVGEGRGFAMLGSPGAKPRRDMPVKQYLGVWKIDDVLDTTLP